MFDSYYPYRFFRNENPAPDDLFLQRVVYRFTSASGKHYFVEAEKYNCDLVGIKFFERSMKNASKRYNVLTQEGKPLPILGTCINIMTDILAEVPHSSFAFISAQKEDEIHTENTQRHRIYRQIMINHFSPNQFFHLDNASKSIYLMLNRKQNQRKLADELGALLRAYNLG